VHVGLKEVLDGLAVLRLVVPKVGVEFTHLVVEDIKKSLEIVETAEAGMLNGGSLLLRSQHLSTQVNLMLGAFMKDFSAKLTVCRDDSHHAAHKRVVLDKNLLGSERLYSRKLRLHVCDSMNGEVHGFLEPTAEYDNAMNKIMSVDALNRAITCQLDTYDPYVCPQRSEFGVSTVLSLSSLQMDCGETRARILAEMARLARSDIAKKHGIKIRTDTVLESPPMIRALPEPSERLEPSKEDKGDHKDHEKAEEEGKEEEVPLAVRRARLWSVQLVLFRDERAYHLLRITEPLEVYVRDRDIYNGFSSHMQLIEDFSAELKEGAHVGCQSSRKVYVGADEHYAREVARNARIPFVVEPRRYTFTESMRKKGETIPVCQYRKQMSLNIEGAVLGRDCELALIQHGCEEHKGAVTVLCRPAVSQIFAFRALVVRNDTTRFNKRAFGMPAARCLTGVDVGVTVYLNCANVAIPLEFKSDELAPRRYAVMERKRQGRRVLFVLHRVPEQPDCTQKMATIEIPASHQERKKWIRVIA
jgi:hypothetical protein